MNNEVHDKIIWRLNANNEYNVKSAYHHLLEIIVQNDHLKVVGNSNLVWKLQVPPKVKYFLWCVLRNCLPIHVRLQTKGVMCHSTCYYYDNFENDFTFSSVVEMPKTHGKLLALEFNWARILPSWFHKQANLQALGNQQFQSPINNCYGFVVYLEKMEQKLWNEVDTTPNISISLAVQFLLKWSHNWKTSQPPRAIQTFDAHSWWTKPQKEYLKLNVDATLFTNENKSGIGLFVCNEEGTFFKAKTKQDYFILLWIKDKI